MDSFAICLRQYEKSLENKFFQNEFKKPNRVVYLRLVLQFRSINIDNGLPVTNIYTYKKRVLAGCFIFNDLAAMEHIIEISG